VTLQVYGAPEGYDALLLRQRRAETQEPVLHVCRDDARMARMADALGFFMPEAEILRLPAWDAFPMTASRPTRNWSPSGLPRWPNSPRRRRARASC